MRIEILDEAQDDLIQGHHFYDSQERGLGPYFLDCLFSDIDSLLLYGGIHPLTFTYHRCLSKRFPLTWDQFAQVQKTIYARRQGV